MRDAFGGIVNITFVVVFIVIVNGYLAFAAQYNKAFRYKNKIINAIEQYEGWSSSTTAGSEVYEAVNDYRKKIGYSLDTTLNEPGYDCYRELGMCIKKTNVSSGDELSKSYYTVITAVNINIPILEHFLPKMHIFQVNGTTKTITQH